MTSPVPQIVMFSKILPNKKSAFTSELIRVKKSLSLSDAQIVTFGRINCK